MIKRPPIMVSQHQLEIASKSPYSAHRWHQIYPLEIERLKDGFGVSRADALAISSSLDVAIQNVNEAAQRKLEFLHGPWGWK